MARKTWRFPIREIAADDGVKYVARVLVRPMPSDTPPVMGLHSDEFAVGINVEQLSNAKKGTSRRVYRKDEVLPDWAWYDMGEFDFSALQKIPRPTMNGLTLYVQGDVEVDKIEIKRKHE